MIISLSLKNWRSHADSSFAFSRGVNVLTGIMGAGKSSVMEALCFALFGSFPQSGRGRIRLEEIAGEAGKETEVKLEFELEENRYSIERKIGKNSFAHLRKSGALLCSGPKKVNEEAERLLGVDYELFTRAIYSEQNKTDYLLSLDPGRRKAEIDELLGLDKFETARANATSLANAYEKQKAEAEKGFDPKKLEEEKKRLAEKKENLQKSEETAALAEKRLAELKGLETESRNSVAKMRKVKEDYKRAEEELLRLKGKLEGLRAEISGAKYAAAKELNADSLLLELKKSEEMAKSLELEGKNVSELKTSCSVESRLLQKKILEENEKAKRKEALLAEIKQKFGEGGISGLQEKEKSLENSISLARNEIAKSKAEISEAKKLLMLNAGNGETCPVCSKPLSSDEWGKISLHKKEDAQRLEKMLSESEKNEQAAHGDLLKIKKDIETARKAISSLEAIGEIQDAGKLELEIQEKKKKESEFGANLEEITKKQGQTRKHLELLRNNLRILQEFSQKQSEEKELSGRLELLSSKLAGMSYSDEKLEAETASLNKLILEKSQLEKEREFGKIREKELSDTIREIETLIQVMEKARQRIEYAAESQDMANVLKNCLILSQRDIRAEYIGSINGMLSMVWPIIYPYADYAQVRVRADEKDYFFEMLSSDWKPFEGFASGGERACLSLALRIAIATVLTPKLSLLILDEPTHNLDENAIEKFSKTLEAELPKIVEQSFIITHERKLAGAGFQSVYLLNRDKEKNEPTKIEKLDYTAA